MAVATDTITAPATADESRSETIAFLIMVAALVVAPFFIYPLFLMQALCFALFACAFNLLIGYVGPAVVRPCALFRLGELSGGPFRQGLGLPAGARDPDRHADRHRPRHRGGRCSRSAARASTSR